MRLVSVQTVAGVGGERVGTSALFIYLFPSLMINRSKKDFIWKVF
jgi:hypothetical protein